MAQAQFHQPQDLKILQIGDGTNVKVENYTLDNPHPGFSKDPNVVNEYGHTKYPMFVGKVIVNNGEEEAAAKAELGVEEAPAKKSGW